MSTDQPRSRGRVAVPDAPPSSASGESAESEPPRRGLEVGLLPLVLSIVGTILVAAIITLVVLSGRAESDPAATHTSAATDVSAISESPTVKLTPAKPQMYIEVSHPGLRKGDVLQVAVGFEPDQIDSSQRVTLPAGVTRHSLTVGPRVQVCAQARVVRGPAESSWSQPQCEVQPR